MKPKLVVTLAAGAITIAIALHADAFTFNTCNGVAVTDSGNHMWFEFDTTCSMPPQSLQWKAGYHAMAEYQNVLNSSMIQNVGDAPSGCRSVRGDGISQVSMTPPANIGGNNGLTLTVIDACLPGGSAHIIEADVFAASTLDFGWPDEPWVGSNFHCQTAPLNQQNGTCDIGLGNFTYLHEMGHALGLQHSPGQVVMHNGPPVPYAGGGGGSGGLGDAVALFPDDAAGIRSLYFTLNPTPFHNVMASDMHEPSVGADALLTNGSSLNPGWGEVFFACPGFALPLWNTSVNNGTFSEFFNQSIFANTCPACTSGGWGIGGWTGTSLPSDSLVSSFHQWSVPGGNIPRQQFLWIFLNVDPNLNVHIGGTYNERLWDNITHYPFVLQVGSVSSCGS